MSDQCIVTEAQSLLSDEQVTGRATTLAEAGSVADASQLTFARTLADGGTLADAVLYALGSNVDEVGSIVDSFSLAGVRLGTIDEDGRLADLAPSVRSVQVSEAGAVADQASTQRSEVVVESATAADLATIDAPRSIVVTESGVLGDSFWMGAQADVAEAANASDALRTERSVTASESARLADSFAFAHTTAITVSETGTASDEATNFLRAIGILAESASAEDTILLPSAAVGWTANTDTWAMSRYAEFGINSLGVLDGKLYGASDQGIFVLDAAGSVAAGIETGAIGAEDSKTKRVNALYAGGVSSGPMQATMTSAETGDAAQSFTYPFDSRWGAAASASRCKPGRGPQSRYWTFKIENAAGDYFSMDALTVVLEPGSRRIR